MDASEYADRIYYDRMNRTQREVIDRLVDLTLGTCAEVAPSTKDTVNRVKTRRLWTIWFKSKFAHRDVLNSYIRGDPNYDKLFDMMEPMFRHICNTSGVGRSRVAYLYDRFKRKTPSFSAVLLYGGTRT